MSTDLPPIDKLRTAAGRKEMAEWAGGAALDSKLDVIAATVQVQRLKHQEELPPAAWAALNEVERLLAHAAFLWSQEQARRARAKLATDHGYGWLDT